MVKQITLSISYIVFSSPVLGKDKQNATSKSK